MSRHPILKWAQRSDKVFLTVDLADAKDVKLKLEPDGKFTFSATKDGSDFAVELELFDKVNVEESKYIVGPRNIAYMIVKAESNWWTRLIKQEGKAPAFLKVDWDKWVDEDEENDVGAGAGAPGGMDFGDMDFSKFGMGGMGGMPGMGGMGGMGGMPGMGGMGGMPGMEGLGGMGGMPGMGDFSMPEDDDDEDDAEEEVKKPEAKVEEGTSKSAAAEEAKA